MTVMTMHVPGARATRMHLLMCNQPDQIAAFVVDKRQC